MCVYKYSEDEWLAWIARWYSLGILLGWISFGTWMYDVANDIYDNYNPCLKALYSLMLSFNCLIDCCCLFGYSVSNDKH